MHNKNKNSNVIERFCAAGLYLVPIPPNNGKPSKAPIAKGWNRPRSLNNPDGYSAHADDFKHCNGFNFGLYHGASQTLALDLDDMDLAARIFEDTANIQLTDWLNDEARAEIKSPKANRGKLLFKLPPGINVSLKQLKKPKKDNPKEYDVIFELRAGNCQDVIYGQHPEGGEYRFIGNPAVIPPIPAVLLDMHQHWADWKPCLDSALGIETKPPKIQLRKPQQSDNLPGRRNPIDEFNQATGIASVLLANGYTQFGPDRFIRPGSESKAPGAVLLRNCADGVERIFSHGGDALNDGFAHDAWDCYRLLECSGDYTQALNWNPEITKHNQRLHMKAGTGQSKTQLALAVDNLPTPSETEEPKSKKRPTLKRPAVQVDWTENDLPEEKTQDNSLPATVETNIAPEQAQTKPLDEYASYLPSGTVLSDSDIELLLQLNASYAHTVLGGKNIIVGQRTCQVQGTVFTFEVPAEFKKKFLHRPLIGVGEKKKNQGQAWLEWPDKNYKPNGTGFYPDPQKCPDGAFNLFRGYQVKPVEGDCSIYLDHLKQVMCAGDEASYSYLVGWMAHLFQRPDIKPNVAIVLKSVEGTGKGTMAEPLLTILGPHGNKTNGAYAIASRFNGTLASRLFIFADEVDLTDKHVADRLKGIISETTVNLERKGLEIEPLPNYCRLIFASNHTRVLNAGIRERRYLVLEPSDEKAQDSAYFRNLWAWIHDSGAAKLLHYLLRVDISGFDPYKCPQTKALIAEKLANLSGVNRFFYGEILKPEPFGGKARIYAHELIDDFVAWSADEESKISKPAARNLIGRMMSRLNINVMGRSDRGGGKFYDLPSRSELVQFFAAFLDIPESELEQ